MKYQKELDFALDMSVKAGKIMKRYFRADDSETVLKADKTLVTKADTEINDLIIREVTARFPGYSVHGEEASLKLANSCGTWVCDPVDGTMPFAKGVPLSTFSLALVNNDGLPVVGVIHDPFSNQTYQAVKGEGAYLGSRKLAVSKHSSLELAYIDQELWVNELEGISFDDPKDLLNKAGAKVVTFCSACYSGCLVASGRFDSMLFGQTKPEDIAALYVIITEAGGMVTDLLGRQQRYDRPVCGAIVSNGKLHDKLVGIMKAINYRNPNL